MEQILTKIIIVLFIIFCIYFIYTIIETIFFSRNKRKVKGPQITKVSDLTDKIDDNNSSSDKKENVEEKKQQKKSVENNEKKETKKLFQIKFSPFNFGNILNKKKKSSIKSKVKNIDVAYYDILEKFVREHNLSWSQKDYYELVLKLVSKGYDKKPSEITTDLDRIKVQIKLEKEENDVSLPHDKNEDSEQKRIMDQNQTSKKENDVTEDNDKTSNDFDAEKELEKITKKQNDSVDTRLEINKTLDEIRALRERLNKVDES